MQCHVLVMLALRMDWSTGTGYASAAQLEADAQCEERTVRRATSWARAAQLLVRTRRGHYISAGRVAASEWQLSTPKTQPDTADPLEKPTGLSSRPNRTTEPSQPDYSTAPSRPRTSRPSTSAPAAAVNGQRPALAVAVVAELCGRCGSRTHKRSECNA